jgi:hypothetical protein
VERDLLWHLHVFNHALPLVASELRGIDMYLEALPVDGSDFSWWQAVDLGHTVDLRKLNTVPILEGVTFSILDPHNHRVCLGNVLQEAGLDVFSIDVEDAEGGSIVNKGET